MSQVMDVTLDLRADFDNSSEDVKIQTRKEHTANAIRLTRLLTHGVFGHIIDDEHLCLFRYKSYSYAINANQTIDFFPESAYYKSKGKYYDILYELIPIEVKNNLIKAKEIAFKQSKKLKVLQQELKDLPKGYQIKIVSNCPFKVGDKIFICPRTNKKELYIGKIIEIYILESILLGFKLKWGEKYEFPVKIKIETLDGNYKTFLYNTISRSLPPYIFGRSLKELEQKYKEFNKWQI